MAVDAVLPPSKTQTALDEAEFEDEEGEGFDRHLVIQCMRPYPLLNGLY